MRHRDPSELPVSQKAQGERFCPIGSTLHGHRVYQAGSFFALAFF